MPCRAAKHTNSTLTQRLWMFCQMSAILHLTFKGWTEWQPVTLFLPFTSCQPQRVKSKQQRAAWQTFNKWDSCLENTDIHRGTLWRICCQAWKPSSQLSGSNDSSLAAWVKSLNVSLTSCSHTAPTSAFYIMYFWSSLHPSQFSCIPFIPSLETICCSERDTVAVT